MVARHNGKTEEASHDSLVSLVNLGSAQFLTHRATGESRQVYGLQATFSGAHHVPFSLHIVDGRACLGGPGSDKDCFLVWANEILELPLHRAPNVGDESPQLCINRKGAAASQWVESWEGDVRAVTFSHTASGQRGSWQCEIYHHALPCHASHPTSMALTIPNIMAYIHGEDYDRKNSNFVKATTGRWVNMLAGCGIDGALGLARASAKSQKAHLIYTKQLVPAHLGVENEREFTTRMFAFILVLVQNSVGQKFRNLRMVGPVRAASLLLDILLDFALGSAEFVLDTSELPGRDLRSERASGCLRLVPRCARPLCKVAAAAR